MFGDNGGELDRNNLPIKERKSVAETFGVSDVIVPSPIPHDFINTQYIDSKEDVSQDRFQFGLGQNQEAIRAGYQSGWELAGKAIVQSVGEATLGTLEGVGYLADWQQLGNIAQGTEDEFGNWFSDIMKAGKEYINEEIAPIYQTESAQQGFAPTDASWWASNANSIASTASLLIPAMGATKVASLMGKGLRGTQTLQAINKAAKLDDATDAVKALNGLVYGNKAAEIASGVTGAVFSRYMENTMEASGTYDEHFQRAIGEGKDPQLAAKEAGEAASTAWNNNWGNLVFDIAQYMTLTKGINSANYASKEFRKNLLQKTLGTTGNILGEGVEEGAQFVVSKEAQRKAEMGDDYEGFKDITTRISDYSKDPEFKASVLLGAVGGGIFTGLGKGISKVYEKAGEMANSGVNKQKALDDGDLATAYKEDAKDLLSVAYRYASEGKLNDLKGLYKKMGEATDEELINTHGKTKEEIEDFRKANKEMQEDLDFIEKAYVRLENDSTKKPELRHSELGLLIEKRFNLKAKQAYDTKIQEAKSTAIAQTDNPQVVKKKELAAELLAATLLRAKHQKELGKYEWGKRVLSKFDANIKRVQEELDTLKDVNAKDSPSTADADLTDQVMKKTAVNMADDVVDAHLTNMQTEKGQEDILKDFELKRKEARLNEVNDEMPFARINTVLSDDLIKTEATAKLNTLANKAAKDAPIPSDNTFESDVASRYKSIPLLHKELAEIKEENPNVSTNDVVDAQSFIQKHIADRQFREAVDAYYAAKTEKLTKQQTKDVKIPSEQEMANAVSREHSDGLPVETEASHNDKGNLQSNEFMMYIRKGDTVKFYGTNDKKLRAGISLSVANTMGYREFKKDGMFILYSEDGSPVKAENNTLTITKGSNQAQVADIEKRREEELKKKLNTRFTRVEDQQKSLNQNQEAPLSIGIPYDEGMKIEANFVDKRTKEGDGYSIITAVKTPQINTDGIMSQAGEVEVTFFDSKEDAEKWVIDEKIRTDKLLEKKKQEINAKYDAELAALSQSSTTETQEVIFLSDKDFEVINDPNINIYGKEITFEIPIDHTFGPTLKGVADFVVIPTININGEKIKLGKLRATYDSSTGDDVKTVRELRQQLFAEWKQSGQKSGTFISGRNDIKVDGRTPGHFNISGNDRINPTQVTDNLFLGTIHEDDGRKRIEFNDGDIDRGLQRSTDIAYNPDSSIPYGSVAMMVKRGDGKYSPIKLYTSFLKEHPEETEIVNSIIDELFADTEFLKLPIGSTEAIEKLGSYSKRLLEYVPIKLQSHGKGRFVASTIGKEGDNKENHITYTSAEDMKNDLVNGDPKRGTSPRVMRVDASKINTGTYNEDIANKGWITTNLTPGPRKTIGSMIKLDLRGFDKGRKVEKAKVVEPATVTETVETPPSDQQDNVQTVGDPKEQEGVVPLINPEPEGKILRQRGASRNRTAKVGEYQKWDKNKELLWFNANYPNIPVKVLDDLSKIANNGGVPLWGLFKNSSIYIANSAASGTVYHEAFHAVFHILLNANERANLLRQFKGKDAIDKEENMADHFMDYKLTQGGDTKGLSAAIKDFFKRLYHLIQIAAERVGLKKGATVQDYMYRVDKGLYNKFKTNENFSKDVSRFRSADTMLNPREEVTAISTFNGVLIREAIPKYAEKMGLKKNTSPSDVLRALLKEGKKTGDPSYSLEGVYATTFKIINNHYMVSEKLTDEGAEYLDRVLAAMATQTENGGYVFSTLMVKTAQDLSTRFGIGISVNRIMSDEVLEIDEASAEGALEGWQIEGFQDQFSKFSERAKMMFAKVEMGVDPADYVVYENPVKVYAKLARVLSASYNETNMMSKLEDIISIYPQYGAVKDIINQDSDLRGEMWINIGQKHPVPFIGQSSDKVFHRDNTQSKRSTAFVSNQKSASSDIINEWQSNFYASKLYNRTSGQVILDNSYLERIDALIKDTKGLNSPDVPQEHIDTLFQLLKDINIPVFKNALNRVFGSNEGKVNFNKFLGNLDDGLRSVIKGMTETKDPFFGGVASENSLKVMANIIVEGTDDSYKMSFKSMSGKLNYTLVDNRFSLDLINKLKSRELGKKLIATYRKDPFFKNSPFLAEFDKLSTAQKIQIVFVDAYKNEDRSKVLEYKDMTRAQLEAFQMINYFRYDYSGKANEYAYFMLPILSDSTSPEMITFKKETDEAKIREKLVQTAQQERDRIEWLKDRIDNGDTSDIPDNVLKNGIKYQIFTDLNEDIITDKNFATKVNNMINRALNLEKSALYEERVLELKNGRSVDLTDMLGNTITNNLDKNLDMYMLNRMYMNIQTLFMFGGDIASYKSKKGDVDFTDVYKRIKQVHSPQNKLSVDTSRTFKLKDGSSVGVRENYNVTYLQDPTEVEKIRTVHTDLINELFPGEENKWIRINYGTEDDVKDPNKGGLNNTDAATYIDIFRAREIYLGTAEWNDALQDQYDQIITGNPITFDKDNQVNVKKPFHYSHRFITDKANPNLLHAVATQIKNSEAVLTPQMAKGNPKLEAILEKMGYEFNSDGTVTFDESKRITDAVIFTSAVKVGQFNVVNNVADISPTNIHQMKNSEYAIQQATPEHHIDSEVLAGTQIRKIISQDLNKTATYNVGGRPITGEQLFNEYQEAINKNILESFEELKKLFYKEDGTPDLESIVKILRKEAIEKGYGEDTLSAFDWLNSSKTETVLPLWDPSISYNVEAIMNSYFKNNITKQKMFGVSLYNASSYGYEVENTKGLRKPQIVIERDNEGKPYIKEVEVLMPAHSKAIYEKYTGTDGYLDINAVPDDLKMGIFYRIPTEGKYSMFHIKVIGYIEGVGGQIIMPDEVTTIAGLDFDIDKLYGMMYNFTEVDGKLVKVPSGMDSKEARDNMLIDLQYAVMSHPDTIRKQLTPGNYNTLNRAKERVIELEGKGKQVLNPMFLSTQREVFDRNMTGAALIGIAANQNVNHSLMMEGEFNFRSEISFNGEDLKSLSETHNTNKQLISASTAEYVAAVVDNAKDPIASFLNLTTITLDAAIAMVRTGHDMYAVNIFMASPAAKNFSKRLSETGTSRSDIKATLEKLMLEEKDSIRLVSAMDRFNDYMEIPMKDRVTLSKIEDTFTKDTLETKYTNYSIYELLKSTFDKSNSLVTTMRAMRFDTLGRAAGPRIADTMVLQRAWDEAIKEDGNHINGFKKFIESGKIPYVKSFYEKGILMPTTEDKNIILDVTGLPYDKPLFTNIVERFGLFNQDGSLSGDEIANIYSHINTALITGYSTFKQDQIIRIVESIPERVRKYKLDNPEGPYSLLMEQFIPKEDSVNDRYKKDKSPFPYVEFNRTGLDPIHKASMESTWKRMLHSEKSDERQLAVDLKIYSMFNTGFTFNFNTFSDILPVSFTAQLHDSNEVLSYREYLSHMHDREFSPSEMAALFEQIVRNGYRSMRMIPFIDPREDKSISKKQIDGEMFISVPFKTVAFDGKDSFTGKINGAIPYIKVPTKTKEGVTTMLYRLDNIDGGNVLYKPLGRLGIHNKFIEYDITNLRDTIPSVYPTLNVTLEKDTPVVETETIDANDRKVILEEISNAITTLYIPTGMFLSKAQEQQAITNLKKALNSTEITMEALQAVKEEAVELDLQGTEIKALTDLPAGKAEEIIKRCKGK